MRQGNMKASERLKIERQHMRERDPMERARVFKEVNLGLETEVAKLEAQRCLQCKNAKCIEGCPVSVRIPEFINLLAEGKFEDAARMLLEDNSLPGIAGRVCPQETQCEGVCVRGNKGLPVAIGYLERFIADWARENLGTNHAKPPTPTGKRVAIVGAGPAGLTAAGQLVRMGHE